MRGRGGWDRMCGRGRSDCMGRRSRRGRTQRTERFPGARGAGLAALLLSVLLSGAAQGQTPGYEVVFYEDRNTTRDELLVMAANVALGGLTAGVRQWRGDGSFGDGFRKGALGGAGTYLGKRLVVRDDLASGVLGRAVAAGGASVVRNASEGRPAFERVVLPVGPLRVRWFPSEGDWYASLDLAAAGSIVWAQLGGMGVRLDPVRTLATGAPVFLAHRWEPEWGWHGRHAFGMIVLRGDDGARGAVSPFPSYDELMRRALGHERVHLIQYDQAYILWGESLERGLMERMGLPERFVRSVDPSLHGLAVSALDRVLSHDRRPWEWEADALANTNPDSFRHLVREVP
jgi:hypothetical protein